MDTAGNLQRAKISPEFTRRLNRLDPKKKVRVIVILRTEDVSDSNGKRQSRSNRRTTVEAMHQAAKPALIYVNSILKRFGGQQLSNGPDALGSITVEATPSGISALAKSDYVKTILEDQSIIPISNPRR